MLIMAHGRKQSQEWLTMAENGWYIADVLAGNGYFLLGRPEGEQ